MEDVFKTCQISEFHVFFLKAAYFLNHRSRGGRMLLMLQLCWFLVISWSVGPSCFSMKSCLLCFSLLCSARVCASSTNQFTALSGENLWSLFSYSIWGITKCLKVFVMQLLGCNSAPDKLMVFIYMAFINPLSSWRLQVWVFSLFCFVSSLYSATMKPKVPPPLPPKVSEGDLVSQKKNAL